MLSLPIGVVLGILLAIVPGPVAIGAMKMAMNYGNKAGMYYSSGSGLTDAGFCLFAVFSTSAVLSMFGNISLNHPFIILIIQILLVVAIIFYGIIQFKSAKKVLTEKIDEIDEKGSTILNKWGAHGPFFIGVAVGFANIASPTFIPSLAYFTLQIDKFNLYPINILNHILLSVGFGLGNFLWLALIVKLLAKHKEKFSTGFIQNIYKFAGYTLIVCGVLLGYKIFTLTDWHNISNIIGM